jgi:hypothetical protein
VTKKHASTKDSLRALKLPQYKVMPLDEQILTLSLLEHEEQVYITPFWKK